MIATASMADSSPRNRNSRPPGSATRLGNRRSGCAWPSGLFPSLVVKSRLAQPVMDRERGEAVADQRFMHFRGLGVEVADVYHDDRQAKPDGEQFGIGRGEFRSIEIRVSAFLRGRPCGAPD